jgi:hypothetical protein
LKSIFLFQFFFQRLCLFSNFAILLHSWLCYTVAEVWSPIYGPCEAIKPFIGPLMQKLEYDNTVQWPVVNIAKLEAEAIAEKKKGTACDTSLECRSAFLHCQLMFACVSHRH